MFSKKLFATGFLISAALLSAADFKTDFSSEEIPGMKIVRRASVEDGSLKFENGAEVLFALKSEKPYSVKFRLKVEEFLESKHPPFFSITLNGKDTVEACFMFRDKNIEHFLYKNKKRRHGYGGYAECKVIPGQWMTVELVVRKNTIQIMRDGKIIGSGKYKDLIPLESIKFRLYNTVAEIDDFSLTVQEEKTIQTVRNPVLQLDFNNGLDGTDEKGGPVRPSAASSYRLTPGIDGNALTVDPGSGGVVFNVKNPLSSTLGGIMFWVKAPRGGHFFQMADGQKNVISAYESNGRYFLDVSRTNSKKPLQYIRTAPGMNGDWILIALTWNPDGAARYYINMIPYVVSFTPGQRVPDFVNADINSISQIYFGKNTKQSYAIDRVQLFRRELTNADIYEEFRKFMPIDMVMENRIFAANTPVKLAVQAAPAGFYTKPLPISPVPVKACDAALDFQLLNRAGKILQSSSRKIHIDAPREIEFDPVTLPAGKYQLRCTVNGRYTRSWPLAVFQPEPVASASGKSLRTGKRIFLREFTDSAAKDILKQGELKLSPDGKYLEVGPNKTDRLSIEIPFPRSVIGKPVALDITWPDDKPRTMGWYMYPHGIWCNRDRLQSGVSAGNEFPNSNRMVTTRHIFYPGVKKYLFECRTLAANMPAAVSKIEVFEIPDGLPPLKVHTPKNAPGRSFGFYDEDQTFTNNLNVDAYHAKSPAYSSISRKYPVSIPFLTNELIRYFRYTGMNTAHLPLWRYGHSYFPLEGQTELDMYPGMGMGSVGYVIDTLRDNGIRLIANMNYQNLPELATNYGQVDRDFKKEGLETLDRYGDSINRYLAGLHRGNIAHPEYFNLFASYFETPLRRYANNPGFGGIEFMMFPCAVWVSLEYGYDDWTVNKFSKDTGIPVPSDIRKRFPYLTGEKRAEWLKWRAEQVTSFIRKFRAMLDRCNPELKLFLTIPQDTETASAGENTASQNQMEPVSGNYENLGIDIEQLKAIPRVEITLSRFPTSHRHNFHWGKPESAYYENLYRMNASSVRDYLTDGVAASVLSGHTYFETYVKPLHTKYSCYFEDADIKPHGRWYLRELAFAVAAFDAQEYIAGGQPLNTIGRDEESREFAQAFRALPAKPFKTIPGLSDPVVARALQTPEGTYFYAVSIFHENVAVELELPNGTRYTDLSTGRECSGSRIELKPFQLRSFLISDSKIVPQKIRLAEVSPRADDFYRKRIRDLEATMQALEKSGLNVSSEKEILNTIIGEFRQKHYAEVYRLSFSRLMNQLLQKKTNLSYFLQQQKQIGEGHYAVNCGSPAFCKAPNGTLYFPDQKFDGKYGYEGRYSSITRDISGLKGTDVPELFKTEAYNLERYRFRIPDGVYKAVLFMKPGFKPNFEEGTYIFTLKINGKPVLEKFDLFKRMKGDFTQAVRIEIPDIRVSGGDLVLAWNHEQKIRTPGSTTICLLNAIEIIRQK